MNQREAKREACRIASDLVFQHLTANGAGDELGDTPDGDRIEDALMTLARELWHRGPRDVRREAE